MGFSNGTIRLLKQARDRGLLNTGGKVLALGTMDFWCSQDALRECGISSIGPNQLTAHEKLRNDSEKRIASSKDLVARLFFEWGYESYEQMDITGTADYICDLTQPLPPELAGRYSLVFDGVVPYVSDPISGYRNIAKLLKVGGSILTFSFINQVNRSQLSPQPNFLNDYFSNAGFKIQWHAVYSHVHGYLSDYQRAKHHSKVVKLASILPPKDCIRHQFATLDDTLTLVAKYRPLWWCIRFLRILFRIGSSDRLQTLFIAQKETETQADRLPIKDVYQAGDRAAVRSS